MNNVIIIITNTVLLFKPAGYYFFAAFMHVILATSRLQWVSKATGR